ncbi:MAG: AAA family ATPase [Acidobacteria bacterium]|nr:AAA family ATPase [Acidobacteriota bacterium]
MPFSDYLGNAPVVSALRGMLAQDRLPQTLLFSGPRGIGKATLARYLTAAIQCREAAADEFCGSCHACTRILAADLSLPEFVKETEEREKLPAAKRTDNPLVFSTHPDFLIFPPDGPLRMVGIEQARKLRNAAQFSPSEGKRRVFVLDGADRANDEAANSLLKTLEEPAAALTIILIAENPYDLLPTIRSRSVPFYLSRLTAEEMQQFFERRRELSDKERRRLAAWAQGSPGAALAIDVEEYLARREAMLAVLRAALGGGFADLIGRTESIARKTREKLEALIEMLFGLLSDLLHLRYGSGRLINQDIREDLRELAERVRFDWLEEAKKGLDELDELRRRNIQKQIALEGFAARLSSLPHGG